MPEQNSDPFYGFDSLLSITVLGSAEIEPGLAGQHGVAGQGTVTMG